MADSADRAADDMEVIHTAAIEAARRTVKAPTRTPTGKCHWCHDPVAPGHDLVVEVHAVSVDPGQVFCDEFCLEDHNKRQRAATMAKR